MTVTSSISRTSSPSRRTNLLSNLWHLLMLHKFQMSPEDTSGVPNLPFSLSVVPHGCQASFFLPPERWWKKWNQMHWYSNIQVIQVQTLSFLLSFVLPPSLPVSFEFWFSKRPWVSVKPREQNDVSWDTNKHQAPLFGELRLCFLPDITKQLISVQALCPHDWLRWHTHVLYMYELHSATRVGVV